MAITHSSFTVKTVREVMGEDFPITAIAAPVWDRFAARGAVLAQRPTVDHMRLQLRGLLIDSRTTDLRPYGPPAHQAGTPLVLDGPAQDCELLLDGVIYTSVFNPYDGRKNWKDMISAFCATFRDVSDATLVLKLTHHDVTAALTDMLHHVYKNQAYRCRIVLIHGYLADADYERLVEATRYVVNSSYGEGQCLPLMEFMSCGRLAIAPLNTAMADYIDHDNAFVVESTEELTAWPHDPGPRTGPCVMSLIGTRCVRPTAPVMTWPKTTLSVTAACRPTPCAAWRSSAARPTPSSVCGFSSKPYLSGAGTRRSRDPPMAGRAQACGGTFATAGDRRFAPECRPLRRDARRLVSH